MLSGFLIAADKSFLSELGITEEEFHAMTWFSSWAVDSDHSSPDSYVDVEDTSSEVRFGIIKHNYPLVLCAFFIVVKDVLFQHLVSSMHLSWLSEVCSQFFQSTFN